jgi:hypothetical protein
MTTQLHPEDVPETDEVPKIDKSSEEYALWVSAHAHRTLSTAIL